MKELLRELSKNNFIMDYIWNKLWWLDVKRRFLQYSDYELAQKIWKKRKKTLNLNNPQTLDEKMWYLKFSNRDPLLTLCSDKHCVRDYIKLCGYENILKKEYSIFFNANEINFDKLPSPCYLKCNHASGMNYVYRKENNNKEFYLRWKFNFLLNQNPYYLSREWNYKEIKPIIICEEVIASIDGSEFPEFQFFCSYGKIFFGIYNIGLADEKGNHKDPIRWAFWPDFSIVLEAVKLNYNDVLPNKPDNFVELIKCAETLSKPFPIVRVDLFNVDNKIYFNELTFYSGGGFTMPSVKKIQDIGKYVDIGGYELDKNIMKKHSIKEIINDKNNR